jgi:hypothetical protein
MTRTRLIVAADYPHHNIPVTKPVREAKARLWAVAPLMMMMRYYVLVSLPPQKAEVSTVMSFLPNYNRYMG